MKNTYCGRLFITVLLLVFSLSAVSGPAGSSHGKGKMFGVGLPIQLEDLPPGRAKSRLDKLPAAARKQALKWLQRFAFPEADLEFLNFDDSGGVLYADTHEVELVEGAGDSASPVVSGIQPEDTFLLHSRPGASNVVFLDFDGHTLTGTAWNSGKPDPLYARPFDIDGIPSSFNDDELRRMQEIWHRVAEDFSPFDIDVTTEDPFVYGPNTGRILITHNVDANNNLMPYSTAGGVAYVGVFGGNSYESYSPALVYYNNLGNGFPTYVAEAASHEFGHNLSLSHDGRGTPYAEGYYRGHGTGYVSWGSIMGVGYYTNVTQWSMGDYAYSNNLEDDLAKIGLRLDFRPDDHGDSMNSATRLVVESNGDILVTNPETENYLLPSSANKGIIETSADVDYFFFEAGPGLLNISIKPAWAAFYRESLRGANLDISATLYDLSGQVIASSDPADNTDASISATLGTGGYYLAVQGVGNSVSPYPDYASLGQYFISGTVPVMSNNLPASPSGVTATPVSDSQINLTWDDNATNETGYYVDRSSDQVNWDHIAYLSANSTSYSNGGLPNSTPYYYRIGAFNADGESFSGMVSATTLALPPSAPDALVATALAYDHIYLTWNDQSSIEAGIRIERSHDQLNWIDVATLAANSMAYHDYGLSEQSTYSYRVVAFNSGGEGVSTAASATTPVQPLVAPSGMAVTAVSESQIDLAWQDNATNESGYSLERSQDQTNWAVAASLSANSRSYSDGGLNSSTSYYYRVVAYNEIDSAASNVASATTQEQLSIPTVPANVVAMDGGDGTATVSWLDTSDNETSFEVLFEKMHKKRNIWQGTGTAGITAADVTQLIHSSGTGNFRYRVRAINAAGASDWSAWAEVNVTTRNGKGGGKCNPRKGAC